MSMERTGLVSRVEADLEEAISLGLLPKDGFLPSEQLLARRYGVSRATAREALLRLAARGLVVQHPGRRSRAVPLSEAVTLENLSVALHGEGSAHPEGRWLLEGSLSLKRKTIVELLAACCAQASEEELRKLGDACFALWSTAPWEEQRLWAKREFELMRLAAFAANLPSHFLLVQSLERSFWGMAGRLLPRLDCEAIRQWSLCAFHALCERDVRSLQRELPTLLKAVDEHLLGALTPASHEGITSHTSHGPVEPLPRVEAEPASTREELLGAVLPNRSACQTGSCHPPAEGLLPESEKGLLPGAALPNWSACQTGLCPTPPVEASPPESACTGAGCTSVLAAREEGRPSDHEEEHDRPTCSPAPLAAVTPSPVSRMCCAVRERMHGS
jgi:GntR family transcriptional repressor for pyruvate dehydrogenase complex